MLFRDLLRKWLLEVKKRDFDKYPTENVQKFPPSKPKPFTTLFPAALVEAWEAFLIGDGSTSTSTAFGRGTADWFGSRLYAMWWTSVAFHFATSDDRGKTWARSDNLGLSYQPDTVQVLFNSPTIADVFSAEQAVDASTHKISRRTWSGTWAAEAILRQRYQVPQGLSVARTQSGATRGLLWYEKDRTFSGGINLVNTGKGNTFGSLGSGPAWTNPAGAQSPGDSSFATVTLTAAASGADGTSIAGQTSAYLSVTNFLFSTLFGAGIPTDGSVSIKRFIVRLNSTDYRTGGGTNTTVACGGAGHVDGVTSVTSTRLVKAGILQGTEGVIVTDGGVGIIHYEWPGTGWTPADLNDSGFGVAFQLGEFTQNSGCAAGITPSDPTAGVDYLQVVVELIVRQRIYYAEVNLAGNFVVGPELIADYPQNPNSALFETGQALQSPMMLRYGFDNVAVASWFLNDNTVSPAVNLAFKATRTGGVWGAITAISITDPVELDSQFFQTKRFEATEKSANKFVSLNIDDFSTGTVFTATERKVQGGVAKSIALNLRTIKKPISDTDQIPGFGMTRKLSPAFWFDGNFVYYVLLSQSNTTGIFRGWMLRGTIT